MQQVAKEGYIMKRKIIPIILSLSLVMAAICAGPETVLASEQSQETAVKFCGEYCTSNKTAQASIDYILAKYKIGSVYPGAGECWGYAEKISGILAASRTTKYYTGLKFNKANFTKKCRSVKAGTHLRLSREKKFNGGSGHSIVLLKVSEKKTCWADNNNRGYGRIGYYYGTLDDFLDFYSQYGYMNMVAETTSYRVSAEPMTASSASNKSGTVTLTWLKTSGAVRYEIYRGYSKTGNYKRIARTKQTSFIDTAPALGKNAYYKVRAIKKKGKTTGNIVSRKVILPRPVIRVDNDRETNDVILSWKAVPRADRYAVYYYREKEKKYKRLAITTESSFRDTTVDREGRSYVVKALYDKNAQGNSKLSFPQWGHRTEPAPAIPVVNGELDEYDGAMLSWNDVERGYYYEVYRSRTADGKYELCEEVWDVEYYDEDRDLGERWYYKVRAFNEDSIPGEFSQVIYL